MRPTYREINSEYKKLMRMGLAIKVEQKSLDEPAMIYAYDPDTWATASGPWPLSTKEFIRPADFKFCRMHSFKDIVLMMIVEDIEAQMMAA